MPRTLPDVSQGTRSRGERPPRPGLTLDLAGPTLRAGPASRSPGAGDGNRTRTTSLEGWGSTIELHPRTRREIGGGGWIRTNVGVRQRIYSPPPLATRAPLRRPVTLRLADEKGLKAQTSL